MPREYTDKLINKDYIKTTDLDDKSGMVFNIRIWVNSKEAADYLRISYGSLRNAVYRKQIVPRKFRRRLYFKVSELNRLLDNSIER